MVIGYQGTTFQGLELLIRSHMREAKEDIASFVPGQTRIPLATPAFGDDEVVEALDSLMSGNVTMGEKVARFERMFANYLGVKHAVMVNSGSSANLLALSAFAFQPGDEIITPAVTWATTVYPIAQAGAVPVLVDVGADYNIDPEAVKRAITPKTKAILPVDLMGNPCALYELENIAYRNELYLIEDACEAHGAAFAHKKTGTFGGIGFFSFYFSHHMTTIEGGMVVTDNDSFADCFRCLRAFGWSRDMKQHQGFEAIHKDIDPRFLFLLAGFNMRPTEIQGAFGIHQMGKLDGVVEQRRVNAAYYTEQLREYEDYLALPTERLGTRHAWFGYPVTVKGGSPFSRNYLVKFLEKRGLETRPIGTGNMAKQPVMRTINHRVSGDLENAELIDRNAFFFGCHQGIGEPEREAVVGYFREFFDNVKGEVWP